MSDSVTNLARELTEIAEGDPLAHDVASLTLEPKKRRPQIMADETKRQLLIQCYKDGFKPSVCAERVGIRERHARRLINEWQNGDGSVPSKASKKPMKQLSTTEWKKVYRLLDQDPFITLDDLTDYFFNTLDILIRRSDVKLLLTKVRVLFQQIKSSEGNDGVYHYNASILKAADVDYEFNCVFIGSIDVEVIHKRTWFTASSCRSYMITIDAAMSFDGLHCIEMRPTPLNDSDEARGKAMRSFMKRVFDSIDESKILNVIATDSVASLIDVYVKKRNLHGLYILNECSRLTPFLTFWPEMLVRLNREEIKTDGISSRVIDSGQTFTFEEIRELITDANQEYHETAEL